MVTYGAQRAREKWRELLDEAQAGETVLVVRNKKAVAVVLSPSRYAELCTEADFEVDGGPRWEDAIEATTEGSP